MNGERTPNTGQSASISTGFKARGFARRWIGGARLGLAKGLSAAGALRRATIELVFPGSCVSCHAELDGDGSNAGALPFCETCFDTLDLLDEPTCRRCSAPLPQLSARSESQQADKSTNAGCFHCRERKLWFDETIAAGLYGGRLRELLLSMKQVNGDSVSLAMGELVWQVHGEKLAALDADVVAPVPSHWRRRIEHRTNSAAVMADVLARHLRLPLAERILRRRRHTQRQFELTPPQRWENVRRAFSVRGGYHLKEAHVLLVDDILTTGATCSEAARTLRKAGASRVTVVVAARAIGIV
jgi:ComF family protein